jgi:hypothetical protein
MQNIVRRNEIKLLSILCLVILLGMQANLTALFLSFEENHQLVLCIAALNQNT